MRQIVPIHVKQQLFKGIDVFMRAKRPRRVRFWSVSLVLVVTWTVYLLHLWLPAGLNRGGPFVGPYSGWGLLTGHGLAAFLTLPLCGDVSFGVASVLLARGQLRRAFIILVGARDAALRDKLARGHLRSAFIMAAIAFALCAIPWVLGLVAKLADPEVRWESIDLRVMRFLALRLTSFGLLAVATQWFWRGADTAESDNATRIGHTFEPNPADQVWRDGALLKLSKGAILPDRCFQCDCPAKGGAIDRRLIWADPLWVLIVYSVTPLPFGPVLFVILRPLLSWRGKITVSLCPRHRRPEIRAKRSFYLCY
jgi:hypothetical protein